MPPITFHQDTGVFTLNTAHTTYQMQVRDYQTLVHLYYGPAIGDTETDYRIISLDRGFCPNPSEAFPDRTFSLDTLPQEYTGCGCGDYRTPALEVACLRDGSYAADLKYKGYRILQGKYSLPGLPALFDRNGTAVTLEILLEDPVIGLEAALLYGVFPENDVITRCVRFTQQPGTGPVTLCKAASMQVDFFPQKLDLIHFHGRHAMERIPERTPLDHGRFCIGSTRGSSSHQHNPFVIVCDRGTDEDHGDCWGFAFVYSGNFLCEAEVDQLSQTRLCLGIHPQHFGWTLKEGESFQTPEALMTFSKNGFTSLSHQLHDTIRSCLIRSSWVDRPRMILANSWEATYFDFDEEKLCRVASEARDIGLDLFVLDDGWFGNRNTDTTALGDWWTNEEKLHGGMKALSDRIHALGMELGLWIEPEMVSEDSDLYRAHPDWCMRIPGRAPLRGRDQLNLDITRPEVRAAVMDPICDLIRSCRIAYIKWDFNRNLGNIYSAALNPDQQGEFFHRYVLALYEMQERLVTEFPELLFENCAGGGGRFDCGMLYYSPQIWCSDNTDAIDRLTIQYGTSFAYPDSTFGAHVSASPNHQTGRRTPFTTRGLVASSGTFGFELDLENLTPGEKEMARQELAAYRAVEELIQRGDYYRLTSPVTNHEHVAWSFVSKDRQTALVEGVILRPQANPPIFYLRLKGLEPAAVYQEEMTGRSYTGAALMYAGLPLPAETEEYHPFHLCFHTKA